MREKRIHLYFDVAENEDGELPGDTPSPNELVSQIVDGLPDEWWNASVDAWHLVRIAVAVESKGVQE